MIHHMKSILMNVLPPFFSVPVRNVLGCKQEIIHSCLTIEGILELQEV